MSKQENEIKWDFSRENHKKERTFIYGFSRYEGGREKEQEGKKRKRKGHSLNSVLLMSRYISNPPKPFFYNFVYVELGFQNE